MPYRQSRSLDNIGENSSMDQWYQNTNHLIFINENKVLDIDGSPNTNDVIER